MTEHEREHKRNEVAPPTNSPSNTIGDHARAEKTKKQFWRHWDPLEKYTFVIAVFTVIYSVVTFGLYCVSICTLNELKASTWMARRAFVGVGGNYIMLDTSKKPYILVQPENSGAIPAEDVRLIIGVLPNIDYSATLSQLRSRVHRLGEIQPSEVRKLRFDVDNWSVEELRKVKEGTRTLYVFGVLRYEDGFGGNRCPPSFCFRYDPRAPAGFKESCAAGEDDGRKYWDKKDCQ